MAYSNQPSNLEESFDEDNGYSVKRIKMEPETMLTQDDDVLSRLNQESSEFEMESNFPDVDSINDDEDNDGILSQHMDIREPLTELRNLLEQRLTADFSDYTFWLQDSQELEGHKNLVEQCIQGEGLVQVNVQIKTHQKRINIVDVLKAADDYPEVSETNVNRQETNETNVTIRWTIDIPYKQEQERLKIPADPDLWTQTHVKHWLQWAVRQFNLKKLRLNDWNITGAELCALELPQFQSKVPEDPGDVFWTHLQLLKKCKFVAVIERSNEMDENSKNTASKSLPSMNSIDHSAKESSPSSASGQSTSSQTNKATNNGQIQLWQFLLELLTNRNHRDIILWEGTEGEFRLHRPETVAQLWGERKNKPSMNYEKLSRALRYYYEGDMISKVSGKRFAYKFDCDLKSILGYSAAELSRLVNGQKRNPDSENDIL